MPIPANAVVETIAKLSTQAHNPRPLFSTATLLHHLGLHDFSDSDDDDEEIEHAEQELKEEDDAEQQIKDALNGTNSVVYNGLVIADALWAATFVLNILLDWNSCGGRTCAACAVLAELYNSTDPKVYSCSRVQRLSEHVRKFILETNIVDHNELKHLASGYMSMSMAYRIADNYYRHCYPSVAVSNDAVILNMAHKLSRSCGIASLNPSDSDYTIFIPSRRITSQITHAPPELARCVSIKITVAQPCIAWAMRFSTHLMASSSMVKLNTLCNSENFFYAYFDGYGLYAEVQSTQFNELTVSLLESPKYSKSEIPYIARFAQELCYPLRMLRCDVTSVEVIAWNTICAECKDTFPSWKELEKKEIGCETHRYRAVMAPAGAL